MDNTAAPQHPGAGLEDVALSWRHPPGMVWLSLRNFLLKILTLGFYGFWGKTEVRRRIWTAMRLNGEPLRYTGTGQELLVGFLIVFGVVVLPVMLLSFGASLAFGPQSPVLVAFQILLSAGFFLLMGVGIHRAQRYRLGRTTWRGIRGGLDGSSWQYAWTHFWTGLLLIPTLGWASPWRTTKLQGLIVNEMRFGDRQFGFDAPSRPLVKRFAVIWIGGLLILGAMLAAAAMLLPGTFGDNRRAVDPTQMQSQVLKFVVALYALMFLGFLAYSLLSAWYRAGVMNHFAAHTRFETLRFRGTATGMGLIWLALSNFFIVVVGGAAAALLVFGMIGAIAAGVMTVLDARWQDLATISPTIVSFLPLAGTLILVASLSLLAPVAQARSARYFVEHLTLDGGLPLSEIAQGAADASKRGEGLAQVFDVDAF